MRRENYLKILFVVVCLCAQMTYGASLLVDDFESAEWAAIADPAPGGFISIAQDGFTYPNDWQYYHKNNHYPDNLILSEGGTWNGTLSTLTTTSMGLKNWSGIYLELPDIEELIVTFDYESAFAHNSTQNVVVGVWEDTTSDPATDNLVSQEIDFPTALAGTFNATFDLSGATGGTLYFFMYKKNWNQAVHVDNIVLEKPSAVSNPSPADGSPQVPGDVTQLCFDMPADLGGVQTIEYDLYWSVDDGGAGVTDPNASPELSGTADPNVTVCNAVPEVITAGHTYFWKVDLNIVGYDPNDPGYDPNAVTGFFPGSVWSFKTASLPPVITINTQEYNSVWLSGGSVELALDATVEDDGLPVPPGVTTSLWTSNPSTGVSFADASSPVTTVTFTAAGDYELTLTADDGDGAVAGDTTIKVTVYAEGHTGLVALYEFEGNMNDSIGGHHGTVEGGAAIDADAKVGAGSLLCSTTGDAVVVLDSGVADPNWAADPNGTDPNKVVATWADFQTTNLMTVSAWVKIDAWAGAWQSMINKGDGWALQRQGEDPTSNCMYRLGSWSDTHPGGEASARDNDAIAIHLTDGNWHHLAGTFDGYQTLIYVDGILEGQESNLAPAYLNDLPLGGSRIIMGQNGNMRLDQVRLHDVPLPANMIWDQFVADGGSNSCRQLYSEYDFSEDCYIDLVDFSIFAAQWLDCLDQTNVLCSPLP